MVYVYAAKIGSLPDPAKKLEAMEGLPEERKQKTLRYKQSKDRKQSLGAGLLLKRVLKIHGIRQNHMTYGDNGKPEIAGICFNLSHSQDWVVCAVSNKMVGCDIEQIKPVADGIAERFFTRNEIAYLEKFKAEERINEFFRIWTMKESYMKMTGEGTSLGLNRFEFAIGESVKVFRDGIECSCSIREYELSGCRLTVCAEEHDFAELNIIEI